MVPGQRWRNRYLVEAGLGEPEGRWFTGMDTEAGEEVLLRVTQAVGSTGRAAVWKKVHDLSPPHVLRTLAVLEDDRRVEVWAAPLGQTLHRWRSARGVPDREQLVAIVRQLTTAIESLHFAGVGHFSLSPDTVYLHEGGSGLDLTLAGFEAAALNEGSALIPIPVDPFSAPPEAAGLFQHSPGESLQGWDWWSLGRLLQELLLGHHVVQILPEGQISRTLNASATALLTERELTGLRAGAVELMTDLEPSLALLLRGLLTTVVTGRWSALEIKEWLAGRQPPERYAAGRHDHFFRFQGRGYTLPEFARTLQAMPEAAEPVRQLFATKDKDTVSFFLGENPDLGDFEPRLKAARELAGAVALRSLPEPLRQEIAAAVAWQGIGGGGFRWRGAALNDTRLREQLKSAENFREMRATLQALATPLVLNYINAHDPETVRLLERMVRTAAEAEELAIKSRWLKLNSPAGSAAIWQAAMESDAFLQAAQQKLHAQYAASDDEAFQKVFGAPKTTRVMEVLLAWAGTEPETLRLVTHAEMKQRKQTELLNEGTALARMIFWLRLDRAMRAGPWLFGGRWFLILAGLALVSLLAIHIPGPKGFALGLLPLLVLAGARLALNRWQAKLVEDWSPESASWSWRDGPGRSAAEARTLAGQLGLTTGFKGATAAWQRVVVELKKLAAEKEAEVTPPRAPRHASTWAVVAFGWLLVLGLAAGSIKWGLAHPPSWSAHTAAWQQAAEKKKPVKPVETGEIKISWPYKVPDDAMEITVRGAFTPTSEQAAAAISRGKALVRPYKPETISSLVAIYVPLEGGKGALLLFDGKKGMLLGKAGVLIDFVPFARTGMQVGDQQAFFIEN